MLAPEGYRNSMTTTPYDPGDDPVAPEPLAPDELDDQESDITEPDPDADSS